MSNSPLQPKRSVGHPKSKTPIKIKPSVSITPETGEYLRKIGDGILSKGIEIVTKFHKANFPQPRK